MAYFDKTMKKEMMPKLKTFATHYGIEKWSVGVRNGSKVELRIWRAPLELLAPQDKERGYATFHGEPTGDRACHYTAKEHSFFKEAFTVLCSAGYYDNSDAMIDHFDCAYYFSIKIGDWERPYINTESKGMVN